MFIRIVLGIFIVAGVHAQTPLPPRGTSTTHVAIVYRSVGPIQSIINWRMYPNYPASSPEENELGLPMTRVDSGCFAVSPNKRWIAFIHARKLWIGRVGTSTPFQYNIGTSSTLTGATWSAAVMVSDNVSPAAVGWAADSRKVVYLHAVGSGDRKDVMTVPVDTSGVPGTPVQITNRSGAAFADESPMFSPDGRFILFTRLKDARAFVPYKVSATGGTPVEVATLPAGDFRAAAWSADGRRIAMSRSGGGFAATDAGIYVMNADGSGLTKLEGTISNDGRPKFSPNGRQILFTRSVRHPAGLNAAIYVANSTNPASPTSFLEVANVDKAQAEWIVLSRTGQ